MHCLRALITNSPSPNDRVQAHAPLAAEQAGTAQPRRFLFVYGCTAEGCGKEPGCWRALRLTLPNSSSAEGGSSALKKDRAAPQQQAPPPQQRRQAPVPAPAADDWGVSGADDWGAADGGAEDWGAGDGGAAAPFDFGDLDAALEAVGSAGPAAKAAASRPAPAGGSSSRGGPAYDLSRPSLPAFYLCAEPEAQAAAPGSARQQREEQHLQQLLARYEAEAAAAGVAGAAAAAAAACAPSVEGGPESWGGEAYEEDGVLAPTGGKRPGVGPSFFKFARQLGRCPDQCARYRCGRYRGAARACWAAQQQQMAPPSDR